MRIRPAWWTVIAKLVANVQKELIAGHDGASASPGGAAAACICTHRHSLVCWQCHCTLAACTAGRVNFSVSEQFKVCHAYLRSEA